MLISAAVTKWAGPSPGNRVRVDGTSQTYLLLTERMFNIQTNGSYSSFYYLDNEYTRRAGNYVEANVTVAAIRTAFDSTYNSEYITLPVYPGDDTTASTVDRDIPVKSISRATHYQNDSSTDKSWLWYNEGLNTVRVLVDYDLAAIYDLADTGTTTTSTTA